MKKLFVTLMCSMVVCMGFMTSCAHHANKNADDTVCVDSIPIDTLYEVSDSIPVDSVVLEGDTVETL